MKTQKPIVFTSGYQDFNGAFVTHLMKHSEDMSESQGDIIEELFCILNEKNIDSNDPVQIENQRYPEYTDKYIGEYYAKDDVACEILEKEEERLIKPDEDIGEAGCNIINYSLLLPLWYIVYMFLDNYDDSNKITTNDLKNMSTKELKQVLEAYEENRPERYVNSDIFMLDLTTGMVGNIGS